MLSQALKKIKAIRFTEYKNDFFVAFIIILASSISFGIGRLSATWPSKAPIVIEKQPFAPKIGESAAVALPIKAKPDTSGGAEQGKFVASKNGKSYHFPWCPGALNIKEANKIWFNSKEEAAKAGYSPAGNCPGL